MSADFASIHNHHEQAVQRAVLESRAAYPAIAQDAELLADVACVALNRLPARYIRHRVDFVFYLTEQEATANALAVAEAVKYAFEFVLTRVAMRKRP